jgi:hypothetical protein
VNGIPLQPARHRPIRSLREHLEKQIPQRRYGKGNLSPKQRKKEVASAFKRRECEWMECGCGIDPTHVPVVKSRDKGDPMNRLLVLLLAFGLGGQLAFSQANPEDPYAEKLVSVFLERHGYPILITQVQAVNRLGDGAAVGLIRRIGAKPPATSDEVQRMLGVIKMAFAAPQTISSDANREPKATLILLSYLGYLPASTYVKGEIEQTRNYVQQQLSDYKSKLSGKKAANER